MRPNDQTYGYTQFRFVRPVRLVSRVPLLPGDAGVEQTISAMREMVLETRAVPFWKDFGVRLVANGPAILGEAAYGQLIRGLNHTFRYVRDAQGTEQLWKPDVHQTRLEVLGHTWGDCDDAAIVAASTVIGLDLGPVRFKAIANGRRGSELNHVFAEVNIDGVWKTLDFLTQPQPIVREKTWDII